MQRLCTTLAICRTPFEKLVEVRVRAGETLRSHVIGGKQITFVPFTVANDRGTLSIEDPDIQDPVGLAGGFSATSGERSKDIDLQEASDFGLQLSRDLVCHERVRCSSV